MLAVLFASALLTTAEPAPALDIGSVDDFIFSPDGRALVVLGSRGTSVVDPVSLSEWNRVQKTSANRVIFSTDGKRVAIAPCEAHLIALDGKHDDLTMTCAESPAGQCVRALIFSPTRPEVIVACPDGSVTRRSLKDGKPIVETHAGPVSTEPAEPRIVPAFENGRIIGLKILKVNPESRYAQTGLRNGDVLLSVAGKPVGDPVQHNVLMELLSKPGIPFEVKRAGQTMTLTTPGNDGGHGM